MRADLATRFWRRVDKNGPTLRADLGPCWLWTGAKNEKGYGVIGRGRRGAGCLKAHRVAFELLRSSPGDFCVLHRCDNASCVNPAHLFLGTVLENNADMIAKGRHVGPPHKPGSSNGNASIDEATARRIKRELFFDQNAAAVARRLGVSVGIVRRIRSGVTWRAA